MKNTNFFLLIVLLFLPPVLAICQNRWNNILGTSSDDNYLFNKLVSYDKGILINSLSDDGEIATIIKTDINGNELWRKKIYNEISTVQLNSVVQTIEQTIYAGSTDGNPLIFSLDNCGNLIWCNKFVNSDYEMGHFQDLTISNNKIIALTYLDPTDNDNKTDRTYLICFDFNGNMLWKKLYASHEDYPMLEFPIPAFITNFNEYFIISGFGYYPFPTNPNLMGMRPLFIRVDSMFNEEWVLPYGVIDSLVGFAGGVIEDGENNIAVGSYNGPLTNSSNSVIMHFSSGGIETGFNLISNSSIGPDVEMNWSMDIVKTSDSNYIFNSNFGPEPYGNPFGELLLDSSYNVINAISRENSTSNITRICKLENDQFLFGVNIYENPPTNYNRNILIYQLNANLLSSSLDTVVHVYNSLCDQQIVSDTIFLNNCDIITDLQEVSQSNNEYDDLLKKILIRVSPNPVSDNIEFKLTNTKHHKNMSLKCYDLNGKVVFEQNLINGEDKIISSVANWINRIYVAIASSSQGTGSVKFIVNH